MAATLQGHPCRLPGRTLLLIFALFLLLLLGAVDEPHPHPVLTNDEDARARALEALRAMLR